MAATGVRPIANSHFTLVASIVANSKTLGGQGIGRFGPDRPEWSAETFDSSRHEQ